MTARRSGAPAQADRAPAKHMHTLPARRVIERHPLPIARATQPAPRDPEPLALSPAEIRRIVLDIIG